MTWIGDIDVPVISDKETAVDISNINTNFVDEHPQSYKLYSSLEAGTFTVYLNPNIHKRSEGLSEQKDSVHSMVERHGTEFPIEDSFDKGFVVVDFVDYFETSSEMFDEADITLRFMPYSDYTSSFLLSAFPNNDDFDVPESSLFSVDSSVTVIEDGNTLSPSYTYPSANGDIDYYSYSKNQFKLDISDFSYERTAPCRLYSSGNRVYSLNKRVQENFEINNSVVKSEFSSDTSTIYAYDSGWSEIGTVDYPHSVGYPMKNENQEVVCNSLSDEETYVKRGLPVIGYKVIDRSDFNFNFSLDTVQSQDNHFISATDSSGNELILIRNSNVGSFSSSPSGLFLNNISGETVNLHAGFVPTGFSASDIAQAIYNYGNVRRSFVKNG